MQTIALVKESEQAQTPLLLLDLTFADGTARHWATHAVTYAGQAYEARVVRHNAFEIQAMSEQGLDQIPRLAVVLANADAAMSQLEQSKGFKGTRLLARFAFIDLTTGEGSPDCLVLFSGYCNPPDEISDTEVRLSALNRMNLQRVSLPPFKIQRRCPWSFPATATERQAAAYDPASRFYHCGYSPDIAGGTGRYQQNGQPFPSCGFRREDCVARGMLNHDAATVLAASASAGATSIVVAADVIPVGEKVDIGGEVDPRQNFKNQEEITVSWKSGSGPVTLGLSAATAHPHSQGEAAGRPTRRFGAMEFVPETIDVRPFGSPYWIKSAAQGAAARYNDHVPLLYGTAWIEPVVTVLRNDGNLTRMEAMISLGQISGIRRVLVSDIEIPPAVDGRDMTGSGWYKQVNDGSRYGGFNLNFTDQQGNPQGDPYGSVAYLSIVVPNKINDGKAVPRVQVLADGRLLETFGAGGTSLGFSFTNNTAWVLLDLLKLARWPISELDAASFAQAAAFCAELIPATDNYGQTVQAPRFQCNLALKQKRAAADVILGVRNNARLFFTYSIAGKLQVCVENTMALQQPVLPYGSNATEQAAGGWPAYVYSDSTGTIIRNPDGGSSLRVFHRPAGDTPNRFALEFQDAFNEYVQDSFAIDDLDDQAAIGQEISQALAVEGIPTFDQAARIAKFHLDKSVWGNTFVEFDTSVKAAGQQVGQIITLTYGREGWENQLFRILRIAPQHNFRTVRITAQLHDDAWYDDSAWFLAGERRGRQPRRSPRPPNPLVGLLPSPADEMDWEISERQSTEADGTGSVELEVGFAVPLNSFAGAAGPPTADLMATVQTQGGTLAGGQRLYYRITARDADGQESVPSFAAHAPIPPGTNTNAVSLTGLRFDSSAVAFDVYRGVSPSKMARIACSVPLGSSFLDTGIPAEGVALPDPYFDHAAFFWKRRVAGEVLATGFDAGSIESASLELSPGRYVGYLVRITSGTGAGQVRTVVSHGETQISIAPPWSIVPAADSAFHIEEPGWNPASSAISSPAIFRVPNQKGTVLLIQGRAADEHGSESPESLARVTAWTIGGVGPGATDSGIPAAPVFSISVPRDGTLVFSPPGFNPFTNVSTISAITCEAYFADEISGIQTSLAPGSPAAPSDTALQVVSSTGFAEGDYAVIGREVVRIDDLQGETWQVSRAQHETVALSHAEGARIDRLSARTFTFALERNFLLVAASANWTASVPLPHVRLTSVHCSVTNAFGESPWAVNNYLVFDSDSGASGSLPGLRTNRGAQFAFQIEGRLAIQDDATPALSVHLPCSVRDVYALVRTAPSGGNIELLLKRNNEPYQTVVIASGNTASAAASGASLSPLDAGDLLTLDVLAVGADEAGRDMTLVVRI